MTGSAWLSVAVLAAIWPFGRDRDRDTGTILDLDAEVVAVDTSAGIDASEFRAMESYRLFLEMASGHPELDAEAMRRLADLQLESGEAGGIEAGATDEQAALTDTIALYEQLIGSFPDYESNDLVLYQLARAYEAGGDNDTALATLDRLILEYPATRHWAEAQFRRGETLFIEQRYADAEDAYVSVLSRGPNVEYAEQSLYKLGWSRFKQLQYEQSLEPFFGLLDRRLGSEGIAPAALYETMGRAEQELVDDTLRVLAIAFSYLDGPASIDEFLDTTDDRSYAYVVYSSLGDLYLEKERFQDAAQAYGAFVERDPVHAAAPLAQVEVIAAYEQGGFAELVLDAKRDFVERYAADSEYWRRRSFSAAPEVAAELKSNLVDLASWHHAEAQSSGLDEEYAEAARWYRSFLDSFPGDSDAASTNFLLAEVLFESGRFEQAAAEYERTAYGYPAHERSAEAGFAALLAYNEHAGRIDGEAAAGWQRDSIASALRFSATFPAHEQAPFVRTDAAERLFALEEFEAARDVAAEALATPMSAELERTAWTVLAHAEFDLGHYAAAESAYLSLRPYHPVDDPFRDEIDERIASSIYRQGEQARGDGLIDSAVDHFLRVGRVVPGSGIRATAEYDAAAALIQAGDWQRAAPVLENFRNSFPGHELAGEATASLAVAFVETGQDLRAAAEFEQIAATGESEVLRREALWRAGELYDSGADTGAAARVLERYVEQFPDAFAEGVEARQRLVELAAAGGDENERMRWLESLVTVDAGAGAERTDRSRYLAARAQLELAEPARRAFEVSRLIAPLDQSLARKRERMEVALEAYNKAASYGIAEVTTAATFRLAELYQTLSRDLYESERPPELSELELAQYDILLEEQAFPFEEEAIALHEVNAARTVDGIYDEWVADSLDALAGLMPARYAKSEQGEQFVSEIW